MAQGAGNIANGQLVLGLGVGSRQWTSSFKLTNTDGATALFAVDQSGNVTAAGTFTPTGGSAFSTASFTGLMTSTVAAGSDVFKFTATSATPTVAWTGSGSDNKCNTTAPAGYLQIKNGSTVGYIPFWA